MISVVLSSYNGERFIEEQLVSIKKQTLQPDEVIISDDCSKDSTVDIIEQFINKNRLVNWHIEKNKKNIGWKLNFRNVIEKANGDYIFLCDQDDIWKEDKIESMVSVMDKNNNILLLASNYSILNESDSGKHSTINQFENDLIVEKVGFKPETFYIKRPGCVYCIRKELVSYFKKYSFDDYPHDAFLWRTAALLDGLYIYRKTTILYRRHANNATGHEHKNTDSKLNTMDYYSRAINTMLKFVREEKVENQEEKIDVINRINTWINIRIDFLKSGRLMTWFKLFRYRDCYWGHKTLFADLLMAKRIIK